METTINSRKQFEETQKLYPWHTLECTEGWNDLTSSRYYKYQGQSKYPIGIIIYDNEQGMLRDAQRTLNDLDLEAGADDQYYDYNPSAVESLIYAASKFSSQNREEILNGILNRIDTFLNSEEEQDEDMVDQYTSIKNFIQAYKSQEIGIQDLVKNTTPF